MRTLVRNSTLVGYAMALGAAMGYGGSQVVAKQVVGEVPPVVGAAFGLLFGTLIMAVVTAPDLTRPNDAPRKAYMWVALAGLFSSSGLLLLFLALDQAPVVVVAPITGINPLFSILLARLFIRDLEHLSWRMVLGAMLAVLGVAIIVISRPS